MSQKTVTATVSTGRIGGVPQGGTMARFRYQQGSVFLRGKRKPVWVGRWREDVQETKDAPAIRRRCSKVLGTKTELPTKRLAMRRLELTLARINAPGYRPGRMATLTEFAADWQERVLALHKPSTIQVANVHLKRIRAAFGKLKLVEIGPERQQAFAAGLSRSLSPKTVLNILGTLSSMLNSAKQWGYITETVNLRLLTLPERSAPRQRLLTPEQARQVIAAAEQPFRTMLLVAAMTGIRAGELLGLQVDDLDFAHRTIHVRRSIWRGEAQTTKSKASAAPLPMPESLALVLQEHLKTWRENSGRLLFVGEHGRALSLNWLVRKKLRPILAMLKIPNCGLHAFRHLHTSLLLETGASPTVAQAQLRHADPRVTLGVYAHIIGDSQRQAVERVSQVLAPLGPVPQPSGEWIH